MIAFHLEWITERSMRSLCKQTSFKARCIFLLAFNFLAVFVMHFSNSFPIQAMNQPQELLKRSLQDTSQHTKSIKFPAWTRVWRRKKIYIYMKDMSRNNGRQALVKFCEENEQPKCGVRNSVDMFKWTTKWDKIFWKTSRLDINWWCSASLRPLWIRSSELNWK